MFLVSMNRELRKYNWFVDNKSTGNRVFGDIKVDWSSIRDVYEILFFETRNWFLENNQAESLQKFERLMKVETESTFIDFPDRVILSINTDELFLRNNL